MSVPRTLSPALALPFALVLTLAACGAQVPTTPDRVVLDPEVAAFVEGIQVQDAGDHVVVLATEKGMVAIEMRNRKAPITTAAFEALVAKKFYNGMKFYRVEPRFKVQAGDPLGTDVGPTGAPRIKLEITPDLTNGIVGAVGMARPEDDPDGADSRFYILLAPRKSLDGQYAVFGEVVKGMEVVERIQKNDTILSAVAVAGLPAKAAGSASAPAGPSAPAVPGA